MADSIDQLYATILERRGGDPEASYVARTLGRGRAKLAQKVGEEAVETVIAAIQDERSAVVAESADLLFHLLMLWADCGITPADVSAELDRRRGTSGLAEKAARDKRPGGESD